jgi:cyanophycinase
LGLGLTPDGPDAEPRVPSGPGPVALVGSGEYLPVLEPVERALIRGWPPRYAQLATAAAPEGPATLARWHSLGADAAARLGVEQVVVPVDDRGGAEDPANAELVAGAGLIYLSGGNPAYLTETLRGTRVWAAIVEAWRGGAALAGCSAGAMALSANLPDVRRPRRPTIPGLGVVPMVEVLPHFDRFTGWIPDLAIRRVASAPPVQVVGIDEQTALVGGLPDEHGGGGWTAEPAGPGTTWQVLGRQSAWLLTPSGRMQVRSGGSVVLPLPAEC